MISSIKTYLNKYLGATPQVIPYTFFKDERIAAGVYEDGYYISDFASADQCRQIVEIYERLHVHRGEDSGAFFGEISKSIHEALMPILSESLDRYFADYRSMVNAFVIKTPGQSGRVPIHQDSASVDETLFSNINVWLTLQDTTEDNGALYVVPRSHHIFTPYRAATITPYISSIENSLQAYFTPLYLKAGQALIFDSRMFHYSPPNLSGKKRIISICKICSDKADVIAYYRDPNVPGAPIEMWHCPPDHLHYGENHNDTIRPQKSSLVRYIHNDVTPMSHKEFEKRRIAAGILPTFDLTK